MLPGCYDYCERKDSLVGVKRVNPPLVYKGSLLAKSLFMLEDISVGPEGAAPGESSKQRNDFRKRR